MTGRSPPEKPVFRIIMAGVMVASASFLLIRTLLKVDLDPALILSAGIGGALVAFLLKRA